MMACFGIFGHVQAADQLIHVVKTGDIIETHVLSGEIQAKEKVKINVPQFNWRTAENLVILNVPKDGTRVKKGDVVISFDDNMILDKYRQKKNEYEMKRSEVKQDESDLRLERVNLELDRELKKMEIKRAKLALQAGDLVSEIEYKKAKLDLERANAEYDLALKAMAQFEEKYNNNKEMNKIKLKLANDELSEFEKLKENMTIQSPTEGVTFRPYTRLNYNRGKAEKGKTVASGDFVMEIPDLTTCEVHLYVHPSDATFLKAGDVVENQLIAVPELKLMGKVVSVDSFVTTRYERMGGDKEKYGNLSEVHVVVSLDKQDSRLRPGMTTRTTITSTIATNMLLLPLVAISEENGKSFVTTSDKKKVEVKLGKTSSNFAEIISGVKVGDKILLASVKGK